MKVLIEELELAALRLVTTPGVAEAVDKAKLLLRSLKMIMALCRSWRSLLLDIGLLLACAISLLLTGLTLRTVQRSCAEI